MCAHLIPSDVKLTVEQTYSIARRLCDLAGREAIPEANSQSPQAVLEYVRDTLQAKLVDCPKKLSAQQVDATQALNLSGGVSNVKVLRGRSLS